IITGRVTGGDGTPQHCAKLSVRDAAGNDLTAAGAVIVYVDGSRGSCEVESYTGQTSTNGLFFIYNIPPGEVFVSYFTKVTLGSGGATNSSSGGMIVPSFPGVAFVQNITNSGTNTAQDLSGSIIDGASSASVSGAQLTFLGITSQTYSSDSAGDYSVPKGSDLNNALIGGRAYRAKISEAGHADTYEIFTMTDKETKQNFIISPISTTINPALGEIYGLLIDQVTGQTAENVTLQITDLNGNSIAGGEITSSDGIFRISNVPPGMVNLSVVSGEDSGNATLYVYPNGVTYFEFVMTKVIPSQVTVSGTVKDLAGAPVGGSQLRVMGRSDVISADGNGEYQGTLESFGRFIIKTEKDGSYDTYNFFPRTGVLNSTDLDLFSISRAQLSNAATQAGIVQSSANGLIVGTTIRSSFSQEISSTALSAGPHAAALGFFNKDAILDIAITNPGTPGTVTVLFGSESVDGGFGSPSIITDGIEDNPSAIAVADFDGNGSADLVVANQGDHSITVLRGDKNGNFTAVGSPIVDAEQDEMAGINNPLNAPIALAAGFFDSDTFADIAVVNEGDSSVIVLLGNGNGTFHPIVQNTSIVRNGVGNAPNAIIAGDFNQDQRMDMAISNSGSGTITVLLGSTDGTFQPLSDPNSGSPIAISAGTDPEAMASVDMNSDARLDLAVINRSANTLTIFIGNTSGGFDQLAGANQNLVPPISVGNDPSSVSVGEFNGDGRADLAITRQTDNSVLVLYGNGDGTFTLSDPIGLGAPLTTPEKILLSDQDRDCLFDLVVVGSHVGTLLGRENSIDGISLEARDMNGARVGEVRYLDGSGQVQTNLSSTSANGGFVIFNVPSGLVAVRAINGGVGNNIIDSIPDAVSYARLRALSLLPTVVSINGITYDPVGPPPAGVPVGAVNIQVLGMDVQTKSDANSGNYSFNIDANGEYIVRLCWDLPDQPCQ
ncbi:MAG: FG-GAP-like repeat-containing protein, partial [Candidatus Manganitrophaceae bacterium]